MGVAAALVVVPALAQAPAPKPATAAARPGPPVTPKRLIATAAGKRNSGDFAGALADYQAADAEAPSPETIEGIAFCQDKLGHFDEALTWYDAFLKNVPPMMQFEGTEAQKRVDAIKAMPGHLHLESNPSNAVVSVDGKEQPTHTPVDVELAPGKHTLHLVAAGHDPLDKDVEVASRAKMNLVLEPVLTPPPPPPPPPVVAPPPPAPPPAPHSVVPAVVVGGLAVVGLGIGIGFGIAALSEKSTFNSHPTTDTANTGENDALAADMGFGIGLTLGLTAVVLYATRNEPTVGSEAPAKTDEAPKKTSSVPAVTFGAAPYVTSHGGGAGALLRF